MTPAHYYMALAYLDLKNENLAIRELETALASQYVVGEMYLALAGIYIRSVGRSFAENAPSRSRLGSEPRLSEAEALCKKAIALDATRPEAYLELARVHNARGASDPALSALKLALPEGKSFPATAYYQQLQSDVFFELGRAYQAKRMKAQAVESYSHALELCPERDEARRKLEELGSRIR